jgi:large subunit ribosomal protein L21
MPDTPKPLPVNQNAYQAAITIGHERTKIVQKSLYKKVGGPYSMSFSKIRVLDWEFPMYAVIEQGSKQYKVAEGDKIEIELTDLAPEAKTIELDKVLFIGGDGNNRIGKPYIEGAKVIGSFPSPEAAVVKGTKLYVTTYHCRKSYQRRIGHRQKHLLVTIGKIEG